MFLGALVLFIGESGVDAPLMFQILPKKILANIILGTADMQPFNLISSVTEGQTPFVSLQAEAWVTQLQASQEAGSCIYLVFLGATTDGFSCMFVKERKGPTATDLLWKPSALECQ